MKKVIRDMKKELDELNGYAGFTIRIALDTQELFCIACARDSLEKYLDSPHFNPETEVNSASFVTIINKLNSVLEKARKEFIKDE